MATSPGWAKLGAVLGGGVDRQGAFEEGRLRTAQTESALAQARERQIKAMTAEAQYKAREAARTSMAKDGIPEYLQDITLGRLGSDFTAAMQGGLRKQEMDLRDVLADPNAELGDQFAAGQGVKGEVLPRYNVTGGVAEDLFSRDAPLAPTPVGEAQIDAATALADQRQRAPAGGGAGPGGLKPPSGYVLNPDYDPSLPPGEGNYPYLDARQPVMGAREAAFFNRVAGSAEAMQRDISNLMQMPIGTSIGILGVGPAALPDASSAAAVAGALKYKISQPETQMYNAALGGMNRALSFVEGQGLVGSNTIAESYDTLLLRPGETLEMAMFKMAQMKQTVLAGLYPHLESPRVSAQQKQALGKIVASLERSVPFEVEDVIALQFGKARSLREAIEQRLRREGGAAAPTTVVPAPASASPPTPASASPPATDEVWERGPDGKLRRATATGAQ